MVDASAYLPMDRRFELAGGEKVARSAHGACLVADVAGFTPLAVRLVEAHGPRRGAEELSRLLNQAFQALIDAVHVHRGSVVCFSGDAITCFFSDDDGSRAARAGLAMQTSMAAFASEGLGLKVSAASGRAQRLLLGESPRLEAVVGPAVDAAYAIQEATERGEVTVDARTFRMIASRIERVTFRHGVAVISGEVRCDAFEPWPIAPEDPRVSEAARGWVLPDVYERMQRGQADLLAELRLVCSLFIGIEGLVHEADTDAARLDAFVQFAQRVLARFEGSVIEVTRDDKGTYLHAVLGAPVSHEDDVARALAAARALGERPPELDFVRAVRVGIGRGRGRTGAFGARQRRTYSVNGTQVNLAARLMSLAAPNQILVTRAVADEAGHLYALRSLGTRALKGTGDTEVFELIGEHRSSLAPASRLLETELVGRDEERRLIEAALARLRSEGGSTTLVFEAEAGAGKSRLMAELWRMARAQGQRGLLGAGDAIERGVPYRAFRDVLAAILEVDPAHATGDELKAALRTLDAAQLPLAPLLATVLGLTLPDSDLTAQITGQARAKLINELLITLLQRAASHGGLVLLIDDLQWCDSASIALLPIVCREVSPLLCAIGTRPMEERPAEYEQLLERPSTFHRTLGPLDADASLRLVAARLGVERLPSAVADLVRERTEGHPLFSEQLAYALRDSGLIEIVDGRVRLSVDELSELDLPDTVQGVITSRIDRLPASQQLTLKVASAIGRLFAFETLSNVHPFDAGKAVLHGELDDLERLDLLRTETPEPELAHAFRHILTQQVTYELMPFEQRRDLHKRIALWYEDKHAGALALYYPLLAHHFRLAEVVDKAIDYLEGAAEQALRAFANKEAVRFLTDALRLAESDEGRELAPASRRARWQRQLGEAFHGIGDMARSCEALRTCVGLLELPAPRRPVLPILAQLGKHLRLRDEPAPPEDAGRFLEAGRAYELLSVSSFLRGDLGASLHATLRSYDFARRAGQDHAALAVRARTQVNVSGVYANVLRMRKLGARYVQAAKHNAEQSGMLSAQAWVRQIEGMGLSRNAHWEEAHACFEGAEQIYAELGDRRSQAQCRFLRSRLHAHRGLLTTALELLVATTAIAQQSGDLQLELVGRAQQARYLLMMDRVDDALRNVQEAIERVPERGFASEKLIVFGIEALSLVQAGDRDGAKRAFRRAVSVLSDAGSATHAVDGYEAVADVAEALATTAEERGECLDALARAHKAIWRVSTMGPNRSAITHCFHYRGVEARLLGQSKKAARYFDKSLELADKFSLLLGRARALYELGRHDEARAIFEQAGARYYVKRCGAAQ